MRGVMILYGASALMVVGFVVNVIIDYHRYSTTLNSAPFWIWLLVDGLVWLIPAFLAFLAGIIVSKVMRNKENVK